MRQRRRLTEVEQRTLITRAGNLSALTQHPSWPELEAEVGRKRQRLERLLTAKLLRARGVVDQQEVDYLRGFINGMEWLVTVPSSAEGTLERHLKSQGINLEGASAR